MPYLANMTFWEHFLHTTPPPPPNLWNSTRFQTSVLPHLFHIVVVYLVLCFSARQTKLNMAKVNYYYLLAFLLQTCVIAIILGARCITFYCENCYFEPYHTRFILVIFISVAVVLLIYLWTQKDNYGSDRLDVLTRDPSGMASRGIHINTMGFALQIYSARVGIILFGFVASMDSFLSLYQDLACIDYINELVYNTTLSGPDQNFNAYNENVSILLLNLVTVIFVFIEIPFICQISKCTHINCLKRSHHFFPIIAGANVAIWMWYFLAENHVLREYRYQPSDSSVVPTDSHEACVTKQSYIYKFNTNIESFTFPVSMEFALAAIEVLIHIWLMPHPESTNEGDEEVNEISHGADQPDHTGGGDQRSPCTSFGVIAALSQPIVVQLGTDNTSPRVSYVNLQELARDDSHNNVDKEGNDPNHHDDMTGVASINHGEENDQLLENDVDTHTKIAQLAICHKKVLLKILNVFNVHTAVLMGVIYISTSIIFVLFENTSYLLLSELIYQIRLPIDIEGIMFHVFATLVCGNCLSIMLKSSTTRGNTDLKASDIILMFALLCRITYTMLKSIVYLTKISQANSQGGKLDNWTLLDINGTNLSSSVSLTSITHSNPECVLYISSTIEYVATFPHYILQAIIIFQGERLCVNVTHPRYGSLQNNLSFLAMLSLVIWIKATFLEHKTNDIIQEYFSDIAHWETLCDFLLPPYIYFLFASVYKLLKVKNNFRADEITYAMREKNSRADSVSGEGDVPQPGLVPAAANAVVPSTSSQNGSPRCSFELEPFNLPRRIDAPHRHLGIRGSSI